MSKPNLIKPIDVVIERIDKVETTYSTGVSGRRYPQNYIARKTEINLPAQVVFGDNEQIANYTQLGTDEKVKGYMVLRYEDVNNKGIELQRGDKVIKLGQLNVELFLLHSKGDPAAHYPSLGGFTLFRMFFSDREPKG